MPTNTEWIRVVVGRLGRPHGIRGEITVEVRTDEPELRFQPGSLLFVEGTQKRVEIESARWQGAGLVVRVVGVADRNAAEKLRGTILEAQVDADELPDDDDSYYDRQLVGLSVVVDDEVVGQVGEVLHLPGQDVLVVRRESASEVLLPFVEAFVPEVDLDEGVIVATPPVGLFDEEQAEVVHDED